MTLEISNSRRKEIKNTVYSAILHANICHMPVKIGNIIRSYDNIKLITYSSQIRKYDISYQELIISAETKDSYVVYNATNNKFCIYYNDLDVNIMSSNRVRWNLAHELGHILLGHHNLCKRNKLLRNDIFLDNIDDDKYKLAETEADYFAQLILVPHAALLGFQITSSNSIKIMCGISGPASRKRYYEFMEWKSHVDSQDEYDNRIFRFYFNFIFKKKCKTCSASIVQRYGKHCPICGQKTLEWGDGNMLYPKFETHENNKLKKCPICDNEETNIEGEYCQICGCLLVNKCGSYDCCAILSSNARYCTICGNSSTLFNRNILKAWNYKEDAETEPLPQWGQVPFFDFNEEMPFN